MSLKRRLKKSLKTMPFRFQREGIRFIKNAGGCAIIGDDMGVGKTLQVLGWLAVNPKKRPVVIVTPSNAKYNWAEQIKQHTYMECQVLSGRVPYNITEEIIIINYDIISFWQHKLRKLWPVVLVMDEFHYLKNQKAIRTKACKSISRRAKHILPLSGTPILNRPIEFYPALSMVAPLMFKSHLLFGLNFCGPSRGFSGKLEFKGASNLDILRKKIKPFFLRRMKEDVLPQLPKKRKIILNVDIDNRDEYKKATLHFLQWYRTKAGSKAAKRAKKAQTLVKLGQLRLLSAEGKINQACDWIDNFLGSTNEKLVVFVYHKSIFQTLQKKYNKIAAVGCKSGKERQRQVKKFQGDARCRLFIGSLSADKEAITLTAASTMIFIEIGWTPTEHDQAEDRINRISQTDNKVNIYYMLGRKTIDEHIWNEVLESKRRTINELLNGNIEVNVGFNFFKIANLLGVKKNGKRKKGKRKNNKK